MSISRKKRVHFSCVLLMGIAWACVAAAQEEVCEGLLEPGERRVLAPVVSGLVAKVAVDRGDGVRKGQVLVSLDSRVQKATVDLQTARAEAVAPQLSAMELLKLRKDELRRLESLFEEGIINQDQIEAARSEVRLAQLAVQQAEEDHREAVLELRQAVSILQQQEVRSPITGVVLDRIRHPGESVQALEPILTVVDLDPLHVEVFCPKEMFRSVERGDEGSVVLQGVSADPLRARVSVVDPLVDAASGTFRVRLDLPNPHGEIPAGLQVQVRF